MQKTVKELKAEYTSIFNTSYKVGIFLLGFLTTETNIKFKEEIEQVDIQNLYITLTKEIVKINKYKNIIVDTSYCLLDKKNKISKQEINFIFKIGKSIGKQLLFKRIDLNKIYTPIEASKLYDVNIRKIQYDCNKGKFEKDEYRQSGKAWLITEKGLNRLYKKKK